MYVKCISTKSFNETRTMHPKSKQVEVNIIPDSVELLEYEFHKIDITRAESYIVSPDWIASKKATINPKNEKDKCFQWSIIAGLNHNIIKEKELKKLLEFKRFK